MVNSPPQPMAQPVRRTPSPTQPALQPQQYQLQSTTPPQYRRMIPSQNFNSQHLVSSSPPPMAPSAEVIEQNNRNKARRLELKTQIKELREIVSVGKMNNVISGNPPLHGYERHMERLGELREELAMLASSPKSNNTYYQQQQISPLPPPPPPPQQQQQQQQMQPSFAQSQQFSSPISPAKEYGIVMPVRDDLYNTTTYEADRSFGEVKNEDLNLLQQRSTQMQQLLQPEIEVNQQPVASNEREQRSRRRNSLLLEKQRLLEELEALDVDDASNQKAPVVNPLTRKTPRTYQYSPRQQARRNRRKTFNQIMGSPQS